MKKLTFHISHFTLHTLILLAGVMMFTSCSDDDNNNSSAPFTKPNVKWGNSKEAVKAAMKDFQLIDDIGYLVAYEGKENEPVDEYDFYFDSDKLYNYNVYLSGENGLKEKILSYLRSEYTEVIPTAKTRGGMDVLGYFYNKDTQVKLSSLTYEDGDVKYCISYADANYEREE